MHNCTSGTPWKWSTGTKLDTRAIRRFSPQTVYSVGFRLCECYCAHGNKIYCCELEQLGYDLMVNTVKFWSSWSLWPWRWRRCVLLKCRYQLTSGQQKYIPEYWDHQKELSVLYYITFKCVIKALYGVPPIYWRCMKTEVQSYLGSRCFGNTGIPLY